MKVQQSILWNLGVFLLYLTSAKLGLKYTVIGQTVTLLWLPSGIALVAILIGGYRLWPGIALGALIANAGTSVPIITFISHRVWGYLGTFIRCLIAQKVE